MLVDLLADCFEIIRFTILALAELDECNDAFGKHLVLRAEDGTERHLRYLLDVRLDLRRVYLVPFRFDDELGTAGQVQAHFILEAKVARVQHTFRGNGFSRGILVAEIALEYLRTRVANLADLAIGQYLACCTVLDHGLADGKGANLWIIKPDRLHDLLDLPIKARVGAKPRNLGQSKASAIGRRHRREPVKKLARHALTAVHRKPQGADIILGIIGQTPFHRE